MKADFVVAPTYACEYPQVVNYSSTSSSNANNFKWFFDGVLSTFSTQNISVTYPNINQSPYHIDRINLNEVLLLATSSAGCVDSILKTDTINTPTALMQPDTTMGCTPLTVTFFDASIKDSKHNLVQWEWFFGDGNSITSTNNSSQTHTYNTLGKHNAYLIVTNSVGCRDTSFFTVIQVGDTISPNFSVDNIDVCIGDTVQISDITNSPLKDSIDTWHYSSESDRLFSCFQNPNPIWIYNNEVGPQDITMTVGFNGCFTSTNKPALVNVKGAVANIYYNYFCNSPFTVEFQDSSINATSIEWQFGDGNISTLKNPSHTYASTGDYQVILKAENTISGCLPTYDTTVIFIRNITASINSDTLFCQNNYSILSATLSNDVYANCARGYRWSFSDTLMRPFTTDKDTSFFRFPTTGVQDIQLITTDINGCKDTTEDRIRVYGIDAQFTLDDDIICLPTTVNFTDLSTSDTTITSWS